MLKNLAKGDMLSVDSWNEVVRILGNEKPENCGGGGIEYDSDESGIDHYEGHLPIPNLPS